MIKVLIFMFTAFIALLSWRPRFEPEEVCWSAGEGDFPVHIFFYDVPCWACNHHICALVEVGDLLILVDANVAKLLVLPYTRTVEDYILETRPQYTVTYYTDLYLQNSLYTGGIFSCVEVIKKLISCNNSDIQVPNQFLRWLWEVRHGSSSSSGSRRGDSGRGGGV